MPHKASPCTGAAVDAAVFMALCLGAAGVVDEDFAVAVPGAGLVEVLSGTVAVAGPMEPPVSE